MKRQIFVVIDFENINTNFITNEYTYNKLLNYYKEITFVNCQLKKRNNSLISPQIKSKLKKFKLEWPTTENEFLSYFKNKKTIIINVIPKHFAYLKIYLLLNKVEAKQVIISNVGQIQGTWANLKHKYNFNYLYIFMNNRLCPLLISILSFLNFIPKIDIRFLSNKSFLKSIKNSIIKNFFYKNHIFHTKKIIPINSKFYDEYKEKKIILGQKYITHLDLDLNYKHKIDKKIKYKKETIDKHYYYLNNFLFKLQKIFKKKVIVSIHPKYDLKFIQKKLIKFKVVKYKTKKLIQNSYLVTDFGSSSVIDAVILNKNIISLISPYIDYPNNVYSKVLKLYEYNIKSGKNITRKNLLSNFKKNKKNYSKFINSKHFLGKNIYGYKVIIFEINKLFHLI